MRTVITADRLITPTQQIAFPVVILEDDRITKLASRDSLEQPDNAQHLDFAGSVLAPGLIDIHVHGGGGHDVMEPSDSALAAIERHMAHHGVTTYLPTTVTASEDRTLRALEHLGNTIANRRNEKGRARPLGIHLEGPFISAEKCGVHPIESLMTPSPNVLDAFQEAAHGAIRMMTIAPEIPGALETIAHAKKLGVHSSLGHSNATYAQTVAGIKAGADHATHTFNAMRALDHREPGIVGAVLGDDVSADIIADGVHVDPAVVRLFLGAKGRDHAVLITDAISAAGMPDGKYQLGALEVEVLGNRCEYKGRLAGSVLTLDRAVRNVMAFAGWALEDAVRLATLNPARLLGLSDQRGEIVAGGVADLVVLRPTGEVKQTIIAGEVAN